MERLHDQSLLARVVRDEKDANLRAKAIARLVDPVLLAKIAEEDTRAWVRQAVRKRLDEIQKTDRDPPP